MKPLFILCAIAIVTLGGCVSSPAYRCPLTGDAKENERCASTQQAYKASLKAGGTTNEYVNVFDLPANRGLDHAAKPGAPTSPPTPYFTGQATNYPAPPGGGAPVFDQPRVFQPWLAPYVDAEGNLRSGEYGYFSTPGRWNYGTLKKAGGASGLFEPAKPGDLGFAPVAPNTGLSARPPAPPSAAAPAPAVNPVVAAPPTSAITQPYKKMAE